MARVFVARHAERKCLARTGHWDPSIHLVYARTFDDELTHTGTLQAEALARQVPPTCL